LALTGLCAHLVGRIVEDSAYEYLGSTALRLCDLRQRLPGVFFRDGLLMFAMGSCGYRACG
jgi:hypothetical protein